MQDLILESSKVDFQGLADKITNDYYENNRDLLGKVIEVAKDKKLNPEEIKRLTEKVNTFAVVKLLKNSDDKKATIPLVDHTAVLEATHPEDSEEQVQDTQVKVASELPNTRRKKEVTFPTLEKTAQEKKKVLPEIFKIETELTKLSNEKVALENSIQDNVDYIISEFYKWNSPDFSKFASEAYTLKGEDAKPVLNKMAKYLNEKIELDTLPYIDDTKDILNKFASVIDGIEKLSNIEVRREEYKSKLDELWKEAREYGN